MVGLFVVLITSFVGLFAFLLLVAGEMRRGLREMESLTREVEALLDEGARQA
jgi:hypothetical protein